MAVDIRDALPFFKILNNGICILSKNRRIEDD